MPNPPPTPARRTLAEEVEFLAHFMAGELIEAVMTAAERNGCPLHVDNSVGVTVVAAMLLDGRDLNALVLAAVARRLDVKLAPEGK